MMTELPPDLITELKRMRQVPEEFTGAVANCGWCHAEGIGTAVVLSHPKCPEAGKWCPVHGWWYFESPQLPPKDR